MCVIDFNECQCSCHKNNSIKHIMACCFKCPHCGKNTNFITQHIESTHSKEEVERFRINVEELLESMKKSSP